MRRTAFWGAQIVDAGGDFMQGPLKKEARVREKMENDYENDHRRVVDIVRDSGVFSTMRGYAAAIETLLRGDCGADRSPRLRGKGGADRNLPLRGESGADRSPRLRGEGGADRSPRLRGQCGADRIPLCGADRSPFSWLL